ncbi:MAG: hypothetical protein WBC27_11430, partial [Candidatus Nanopelagicales bacterium]
MNEFELRDEYEIEEDAPYPWHFLELAIDVDEQRGYVTEFADGDHSFCVSLPDAYDATELARWLLAKNVEDVVARVLADAVTADKWTDQEDSNLGPDGRRALDQFRSAVSQEKQLMMVTTDEVIEDYGEHLRSSEIRDNPLDQDQARELFEAFVESL